MSNAPSGQLAMLILALSLTLHLATTGAAMSPSVSPAFAPASPHLALHHAGRRLSLTPRDAMPLRTAAPTAAPLVPGARLQLQCALGRDGQARSPSRTCSGAQSGGRGVGMGLDVRWGRPWGLAPLRSKPVGEERDAELEKSGSEEALSELVKLKHEANAGDAEAASALSKSSEVAAIVDQVSEDKNVFLLGVVYELMLGLIAIGFGYLLGVNVLGAGFAVTPAAVGQGLLWACIPLVVMNVIGKFEFDAIKEVQLITDAFARKLFLKRSVWQILLFSFAAGFGEELLFRGAIQQKLCLLMGSNAAVAVAALGFGLAHLITPLYFFLSATASLLFSAAMIYSGSNIVVPIVAHAFYDFATIQITIRAMREKDEKKAAGKP